MFLAPLPALVGWRRERACPRFALLLILVVLPVLWCGELALMAAGVQAVSGFWDCWPHCTVTQEAAGIVVWWTPVVTTLLVLVAVVDVVRVSRRAR